MNYPSGFFLIFAGFFMASLAMAHAPSMARKTLLQNASPADYIAGSNNIKQDEAKVDNLIGSHTSSAKSAREYLLSKNIVKGAKPNTHLVKKQSELMNEERMLLVYYVDYPSAKTHPPTKPPGK
eukprot:c12727_g1_i1 orf=671-1042(-)